MSNDKVDALVGLPVQQAPLRQLAVLYHTQQQVKKQISLTFCIDTL